MNAHIEKAQRIIIKIGSSLLVNEETGKLNDTWLESLCADIAELRKEGKDVLIVSSGSIALGRNILGFAEGRLKLEDSQAAAATGQIALAQHYRKHLANHGLIAAQILLTLSVTEERRQYLNARNTLEALLKHGAVPVINENDTVATSEIRYGDNDRLSARVANMIFADCLILLSDVDGLYTSNPEENENAEFVPEVRKITADIEAMAGKKQTKMGSGGMETKIKAARMALAAGCHMAIVNGHHQNPISRFRQGAKGTWFISDASPKNARKLWISSTLKTTGNLYIDAGAETALRSGKSLLPAGVTHLEGDFEKGDAVIICNEAGSEVARGLVAYDREEAERIMGQKTEAVENIIGYRGRGEMVHRDDLIMAEKI